MTDVIDFKELEALAKTSVARAAFWSAFSDAVKVIAEAARTEAIEVCGSQLREATTAEDEAGKKVGKLSRSLDTSELVMADRAAVLAYFERAYPLWVDVTEREFVPAHWTPEVHELNGAAVKQWLAGLAEVDIDTEDGNAPKPVHFVDTETGNDVTEMVRRSVTDGRWTLTKDKAAKARVLTALKAMLDSGVPMPADARAMIEGAE